MLVLSPSYSGRAWVKLGDVDACKMHTWTLHFITCYSMLFASYKGYIHDLYWVLGIINNFPIFLELTLRCQKTHFFYILMFQGPKRHPNDLKLYGDHFFWKERNVGAKESKKRRPEGQNKWAHAARFPNHVGPTKLALGPPLPSIFLPEASSWPKNDYI